MILSIASGKGGTGKTTVATNLALSLDSVQLLDCDVEEPNSHVFLDIDLKDLADVSVTIPQIDKEKCSFCGKCSDFCAYNALAVVPQDVLVFDELCHSCNGCALVCPEDAIFWKSRVIGTLQQGFYSDSLEFIQGQLNVGEMQAVPVIKALKKHTSGDKNVIIDSPPGTSCPVIETVQGSDYCILVTEPTPFGLHDLKLAVEVLNHLELPFGVIINRDGFGDNNVEEYCTLNDIPILLKIPHDERIAHLYSQGKAFVLEMPEWKDIFSNLYFSLLEEVNA